MRANDHYDDYNDNDDYDDDDDEVDAGKKKIFYFFFFILRSFLFCPFSILSQYSKLSFLDLFLFVHAICN